MKKGALLYTPEDAERNRWFIESFIESGKSRDCGIVLCTCPEDIPEDLDFAVNRSRCSLIADELEERGVAVFNSAFVTDVTGDKWDTFCYLRDMVPMADTFPAGETCPVGFPCVVKPRHGHGGMNVLLVRSAEEYADAVKIICGTEYTDFTGRLFYEEAIVQPVLDTGKDLRVYVIGGKVIASVLRTSATDFRSNYSLGGRAETVSPGEDILGITDKLCSLFGFGFAGIDFIFDGGRPVVNEIEDAAGSRMLYSLIPDTDIPGMFMDHILMKAG